MAIAIVATIFPCFTLPVISCEYQEDKLLETMIDKLTAVLSLEDPQANGPFESNGLFLVRVLATSIATRFDWDGRIKEEEIAVRRLADH